MLVRGSQLSLFGRSALTGAGVSRSTRGDALTEVDPTDPLKDPTSSEYRQLQELKQRDREVRQHEQAHVAAGGQHVKGAPSYQYQRGPDGRQYATGGEVQIDTSAIPDDPEATIRKMQVVRQAALAPAEPSPQDRAVAAEAGRTEAEARAQQRTEEQDDTSQEFAGPSGMDRAATEPRDDRGDAAEQQDAGDATEGQRPRYQLAASAYAGTQAASASTAAGQVSLSLIA